MSGCLKYRNKCIVCDKFIVVVSVTKQQREGRMKNLGPRL